MTVTDPAAALDMVPLFHRGRCALAAYVDALPTWAQPLGGARSVAHMDVVTAADFDTHARLIRTHVWANMCMVHVLCEEGQLCAIVQPRHIRHW